MSVETAFATLREVRRDCVDCGKCIVGCEVLHDAGSLSEWVCAGDVCEMRTREGLSVADIAEAFLEACEGVDLSRVEGAAAALSVVARIAERRPELVFAVRRCCMCGHCTASCPRGVDARRAFTVLRELFNLAGVVSEADFSSTKMDTEWHIFSVYRAVHGIYYQDLPHVSEAAERGADTLFFPGCPLASYAPALTREAFAWLQEQGMNVVFSEDCCGSPFKSAGRLERGAAFKRNLVASFVDAGIKRVVCVCPGCVEELEDVEGAHALEFVPLPRLMADAGTKARVEKIAALVGPAAQDAEASSRARVAVFDSCHDRAGRFGEPLRALLADVDGVALTELPHRGEDAICCGAAGSVSLVDPDLCARRAHRVLDEETAAVDAQLLVANCPTCSYTWAAQRRSDAAAGNAGAIPHANYLELMFESSFDWDTVFTQLETMWSGEYGAWVCQQLL